MKRPITPRGHARLRAELKAYKLMRPEIANAIEVARGHGDLSENGDYDAAKEKSGMVEAKIRDLEIKVSNAEIIDPRRHEVFERVLFGMTVTIEELDSGEQRTLSIFGADESDVEKGWISYESPLGKSLIGKELGEVVRVALPGGAKEYEISEIFLSYEEDPETAESAEQEA